MVFYIHIVVQPPMAMSCVYLCMPARVLVVSVCLSISLYLSMRVCVFLSLAIYRRVFQCTCPCLSMSVYMCCVPICVSVCPWLCGSVCGVHVSPWGVCFNVCLCLHVSVSISMPVCVCVCVWFWAPSVHVCFCPFHVSVGLCPMGVCAWMSVSKTTCVRVCPWLGLSVGGGISLYMGLPKSTCLSLLHLCVLSASPVACLPLPTPPACFCLSWLVPACLPLSASAVFVCVCTRDQQTMGHEPWMVYFFLMNGGKIFLNTISWLVKMLWKSDFGVHQVILEQSHTYLFALCLWLLSHHTGRVE